MENKEEKRRKVRLVNDRSRAREIVNEIINFGVNDNQIIHVMFLLALNLEDNEKMKEIVNHLKKFNENINTENREDNIVGVSTNNKIILN